jgi:hypothetical protein
VALSRLKERRGRVQFDSIGNLVKITGKQPDGVELLALRQDAQEFGERCLRKVRAPSFGQRAFLDAGK